MGGYSGAETAARAGTLIGAGRAVLRLHGAGDVARDAGLRDGRRVETNEPQPLRARTSHLLRHDGLGV